VPLSCSVVIPVWNPGPSLQRCLDSLLAQTMPRPDYEIICVDDGSTDGTAARLDEFAAEHPGLVRVLHIEHTGWPGTPRNVGIDAARAPYLHFVDNDDVLPRYALADLHAAAVASDADVVLGRPASDFRSLNYSLYRGDIVAGTLAQYPELAETLTPHKMFRRELLQRHHIRFPDGPTPLEDQFFVLPAYLHARAITMLTDRPYYYYLRRVGSGRNAGDRPIDPVAPFESVQRLLDIMTDATDDAGLRDLLFRRTYRVVLLPRLGGKLFLDADPATRRAVLDAMRQLGAERFGPAVHRGCGAAQRMIGRLVADDDLPGIAALAERVGQIGLAVQASAAHWHDGSLRMRVDGLLRWQGEPLRCEWVTPGEVSAELPTGGAGIQGVDGHEQPGGWALPAALAPGVPTIERLVGIGADPADVELALTHRATGLCYGITEGLRVAVDDSGIVRVGGTVRMDPADAAAGAPLAAGVWDVRLRLRFEGWYRIAEVRLAPGELPGPLLGAGGRTVWPYRSNRAGALAWDVDQWIRTVADHTGPTSLVTASGTAELQVTITAEVADGAEHEVELLLAPESGTPTGILTCRGALAARGHAARGELALPETLPEGTWRVWLRLAGSPAAAPTPLPWRVRRTADRLIVRRARPVPAPTG